MAKMVVASDRKIAWYEEGKRGYYTIDLPLAIEVSGTIESGFNWRPKIPFCLMENVDE